MKRLLLAVLAVVCFAAFAGAQDVMVDLSHASGKGTNNSTFRMERVVVKVRERDPATGEETWKTHYYSVEWKLDNNTYHLIPVKVSGYPECSNATLFVKVTNAATGLPVSRATVTVGKVSGTADYRGITFRDLQAGVVTVTAQAHGYISKSVAVTLECGVEKKITIPLLPEESTWTAKGDIKIVLTWGDAPEDLDAHLTGPMAIDRGERFHVYSEFPNRGDNGPLDPNVPAWLDADKQNGFGPETITITKVNGHFVPGEYRYSVYHYRGRKSIPVGGAVVKIYEGIKPLKTFTAPLPPSGVSVGNMWVWRVCEIIIDDTGKITIVPINDYMGPVTDDSSVF